MVDLRTYFKLSSFGSSVSKTKNEMWKLPVMENRQQVIAEVHIASSITSKDTLWIYFVFKYLNYSYNLQIFLVLPESQEENITNSSMCCKPSITPKIFVFTFLLLLWLSVALKPLTNILNWAIQSTFMA